MFALVLLQRMKGAGAEQRTWETQFGFRSNCGTADAIFVARRVLEETWTARDRKTFLLLHWA